MLKTHKTGSCNFYNSRKTFSTVLQLDPQNHNVEMEIKYEKLKIESHKFPNGLI